MAGREIARKIGYVPQRYGDDELTVFDAVLLGRRPHIHWRVHRKDARVVEGLLIQLGLSALAMRPVKTLSGGEIQKVIIARALAQEPQLLLLDEPTSNLDLKNQMEVIEIVRDSVQTRYISAILAVHDLNLALRCADRLILLKDGSIHLDGDPAALTPDVIRAVYGVDAVVREVEGQRVVVIMDNEKKKNKALKQTMERERRMGIG
jgi:iron complex transport system ATP-binding protein